MRLSFRAVAIAALTAGLVPAAGAAAPASAARSAISHVAATPVTRLAANSAPGGTRLWVARYNAGTGRHGQATSVAVNPKQPIVYVTGGTIQDNFRGADATTVAYSTITGAQLWVARYQGGPQHMSPGLVTVSPDGSRVYVVAGTRIRQSRIMVLAYNAVTGAAIWTGRANDISDLSAIAISPDGSELFVAANPVFTRYDHSYHVIAFSTSDGAQLWLTNLTFPPRAFVGAIGVSPDSSKVFVTGVNGTAAFDALTGAKLWLAPYKFRWNQIMSSLAVSPDGSKVFVTGSTRTPPGTSEKYLTIGYDATTGTRLWQARYFAGTAGAAASSVAVSPDSSRVFVTGGASNSLNTGDATTLGYDAATGTRLWVARYPNPASQSSGGRVIMVSPDGSKVFMAAVVGPDNCCTQQGFAVAGYDAATGAQLWKASYGSPNQFNELASAAISQNGDRLFLAGTANALQNTSEYLTVAFHS